MEFDIVGRQRWSMEFDIVGRQRRRCTTVDGVRHVELGNVYGRLWLSMKLRVRLCRTVLSAAEFAAGRTLVNRRSLVRRPWRIWTGIHPRASPSIDRGTPRQGTCSQNAPGSDERAVCGRLEPLSVSCGTVSALLHLADIER